MRSIAILAALGLLIAGCAEPTQPEDDASVDSVTVTSAPESGEPGETVEICWRVEGEGEIEHTMLHFANESQDDNATFQDYPLHATPPANATAPFELPDEFCAEYTLPDEGDVVYFRAHAMVDAPGVLSDEHHINVTRGLGLPLP